MKIIPEQQFAEFVAACRAVVDHKLVQCSSGNLSWRVDETRMLIKCSRAWMGTLTRADVAVCRIADGAILNDRQPSVELGFHAGILRTRPRVNVVLHCQTPCATALACMRVKDVPYTVIPEIPFYIGPIAEVPYLPPGSAELAQAVTQAMEEHDLAVLRNHGQVTVGQDFAHALQNAVLFELACSIILRAGDRLQPLSDADIRALRPARKPGQPPAV